MDIPTKDWAPSKKYSIDDIVRVWNLALPPYLNPNDISDKDYFAGKYVARLGDDGGNYVLTDAGEYISTEIERGEIFKEKTVTKSTEVAFGLKFPVDPTIGYTAKAMVRKNDEDSDTIDPFLTHIELSEGKVDMDKSIGVGVGIKFYDSNLNYIQPENQRMTVRPMASSELSHTEWYRVQLDIEPKHIPPAAEIGEVFIFLYGIQKGGFDFRKVEVTNLSKFFYCTEDHLSSPFNMPGGSSFWTQDFNWRPSYGSSSSFAAINEAMALGEGSDYSNNLAINSLPMEVSLSFKGRTDKEAKAIVHFLQEKHFAYESIFALDYRGSRLLSSDVQSFNFIYTHPYRKDLKFTCVDFSHSMDYRNNNTVSARFVCNTESSIRSVESHSGYNERIDAVFPAYIDKDTDFVKGKKMKLNSFSLEEGEDGGDKSAISLEGLISITPFGDIVGGVPKAGLLSFSKDQDLKVGDCIYVNVLEPEDSIYSIGLGKIFKVIDSKKFVFGKGKGYVDGVLDSRLLSEGSADDVSAFGEISTDEDVSIDTDTEETLIANMDGDAPVEIKKLFFCPEDCLASQPILPDTECGKKVSHKVIDPATGEYRKRVIMLKNYRKLQLETDIDAETFSIDVVPLSSFTLTKEDDFQMLIPAVCGRSSIYIEDPDKITKYPWIKIRNFEHKPTLGFNLANKPKHHQSNFLKFYNKKYKKSINQNMSTFSLTFDKRDDEEAAEILQFLESHLGYKKFRFTMPRPYLADDSSLTTQSRSYNSVFYCPSWDHQLAYKNNHTITATFIESSTGLQEDFANPEGPCLGAKVYDPVTEHSLCTFPPVMVASPLAGFNESGEMELSVKQIDMVVLVQHSLSMTAELGYNQMRVIDGISDILKKIFSSYDNYKFPGTESYGVFDAPNITRASASGNENVPPFPSVELSSQVKSYLESLDYSETFSKENFSPSENLISIGYDINNIKRFTIKIDHVILNIGVILGTNKFPLRAADLSYSPNGIDRISYLNGPSENGYQKAGIMGGGSISETSVYGNTNGGELMAGGLAQLYNSVRSEKIDQRVVLFIGDGKFDQQDEWNKIISGVNNKELTKRRPKDEVLHAYGVDLQMGLYSANLDARQNNPDTSDRVNLPDPSVLPENPSWYEEQVPTFVSCLPAGESSDPILKQSCYDYDQEPDDPQFYGSGNKIRGEEEAVTRLFGAFNIADSFSYDTGYRNLFSVNIKNCGPQDVRLKNTIVNSDAQTESPKHYIEKIRPGIIKGSDYANIQYLNSLNWAISPVNGGQYFDDVNNEKIFTDDSSRVLWHAFNTKKEVFRLGEIHEVDGGWTPDSDLFHIHTDDGEQIIIDTSLDLLVTDPIVVGDIETQGVLNEGVAFKNMPVKVFGFDSGLELIDYNISNVSHSKECKGDYSILPVLKKDESIDLFFGLRGGIDIANISENIQMVFNAETVDSDREIDCFANISFPAKASEGDGYNHRYGDDSGDLGLTFDADYIVFTYQFLDGRDMDTRTTFIDPSPASIINQPLGWCKGSSVGSILQWGGDNLGTGVEGCLFDVQAFKNAHPGHDTMKMKFEAWWYGDKGSKPLSIYAALYKGGTPRSVGYGFTIDNPVREIWVRSMEKIVNRHQSSCVSNPDFMANFTYHIPTLNGMYDYNE
jgi:phage-related protein